VLEVLERFLGFHLVWERAIQKNAVLRRFHESRSRVPHLRRDLAALGRTNDEMAKIPLCHAASRLTQGQAAAVGSIYVLEGSTLGGQVIGRAMADAAWLPHGGLAYFNPYGVRTGEMWRGFGRWAEASVAPAEQADAVAGANRTFELLQAWMTS
jgi:heme oxygenase